MESVVGRGRRGGNVVGDCFLGAKVVGRGLLVGNVVCMGLLVVVVLLVVVLVVVVVVVVQGTSLQGLLSLLPPLHWRPPPFALCSTLRTLICLPLPQVFEHSLQSPYLDQTQS